MCFFNEWHIIDESRYKIPNNYQVPISAKLMANLYNQYLYSFEIVVYSSIICLRYSLHHLMASSVNLVQWRTVTFKISGSIPGSTLASTRETTSKSGWSGVYSRYPTSEQLIGRRKISVGVILDLAVEQTKLFRNRTKIQKKMLEIFFKII